MTLKVQVKNYGPFGYRPLSPEGWSLTGSWAVNPTDGSYFGVSDLDPDSIQPDPNTGLFTGLVALHEPPNGWQTTPTGVTLTKTIA